MIKKSYSGLAVSFIPMDREDIVTQSSSTCEIVSVQYYVGQYGYSKCDTEGEPGGDEYSYNWNNDFDPSLIPDD